VLPGLGYDVHQVAVISEYGETEVTLRATAPVPHRHLGSLRAVTVD
jgi:hypothetical protein